MPEMTPGEPVVVVTGASSGIGEALAHRLAARGRRLLLVARRGDRLERLAVALRRRHGVEVEWRACDLSDRAARRALVEQLRGLEVELLCNNAGFSTCGPIAASDPAREAQAIEVNAVALHELTLAVLPGMLERRRGAILMTGSNAGEQPVPTVATYAATKAFVNTFAEALHEELRGTGVRCTVLAPGPVRTEFADVAGVSHIHGNRLIRFMTAERVAEAGIRGLEDGRRIVTPGAMAKLQALAGRYTPRRVLFPVMRTTVLPMMRASGQRVW
jgi:uncharacterized protein